jgi:hypothetical protein
VTSDVSSLFKLDISQSYGGEKCTLVLLFLAQSQLQTSSCTFSSNGTIDFARFSIPTASSTSYFDHPNVAMDLGTVTVAPGP